MAGHGDRRRRELLGGWKEMKKTAAGGGWPDAGRPKKERSRGREGVLLNRTGGRLFGFSLAEKR